MIARVIIPMLVIFGVLPLFGAEQEREVAVVKAEYDHVEVHLKKLRIPHTVVSLEDLQKKSEMGKYRALFLPCGIGAAVETSVMIQSRNTRIEGVSLKKGAGLDDEKAFMRELRDFINKGGRVYFSGYSIQYLQEVTDRIEFFEDFPNIGVAGNMNIRLEGIPADFSAKRDYTFLMGHYGWVAVRAVQDGEVLATGSFSTARGPRRGIISALLGIGKGEALFVCYHDNNLDDLGRFIIYRITHGYLADDVMKKAKRWDQTVQDIVIDAAIGSEADRTYSFGVQQGTYVIYVRSGGNLRRVSVTGNDGAILASTDEFSGGWESEVERIEEGVIRVRIHPETAGNHVPFGIIIARGKQGSLLIYIIPGLLFSPVLVAGLVFLKRALFPKKFSGYKL